jgi:hypothetical protein
MVDLRLELIMCYEWFGKNLSSSSYRSHLSFIYFSMKKSNGKSGFIKFSELNSVQPLTLISWSV